MVGARVRIARRTDVEGGVDREGRDRRRRQQRKVAPDDRPVAAAAASYSGQPGVVNAFLLMPFACLTAPATGGATPWPTR
jgi:hypothetical protein